MCSPTQIWRSRTRKTVKAASKIRNRSQCKDSGLRTVTFIFTGWTKIFIDLQDRFSWLYAFPGRIVRIKGNELYQMPATSSHSFPLFQHMSLCQVWIPCRGLLLKTVEENKFTYPKFGRSSSLAGVLSVQTALLQSVTFNHWTLQANVVCPHQPFKRNMRFSHSKKQNPANPMWMIL